ncbi:MAG: ABC transporter ATP-binding protein [Desulfobulbaceae bacterium]|nr:MAG: ABC transporter ATP-binding protein [Desulfobulbaceae bacterium]
MSTLLNLDNVCFSYPHCQPILNNCNFSIGDQRIGLIGSNGSGKTTLLKILVGLLKPQQGRLFHQGSEVTSERDYRKLRKNLGFLFQNSNDQLFSPTVIEDIAFGPLNMGLTQDQARERSLQILKKLDILSLQDQITHRLSGGEKKLVALATVLVMNPRLLLLDEPTNNLDPETREKLTAILRDLEIARIIISHDWDFLTETTDELYSIEHGHLHQCKDGHVHVHQHVHEHGDKPHHHS